MQKLNSLLYRVLVSFSCLSLEKTKVFLYTRARTRIGARNVYSLFGLIVTLSVIASLVFTLTSPVKTAAASAADTINFQARLENSNGAIVADGNYNVEFKLYDGCTNEPTSNAGCSNIWTEDYLNSASEGVRVSNGYLTVNLGSITAFPSTIPWSQQLYLGINIGGTGNSPTWDGEMAPRLALTSVPYAFQAQSATQLQTTSGSNTATLSFTTPTSNDTISLPDASGTVCLENSSSCGFATSSGSGTYIQNGTTLQTAANFDIQSSSTTAATAVLEAISGQTADYLTFKNSSGSAVSGINSSGQLYYNTGSYNGTLAYPNYNGTQTICTVQSGNCAGSGSGITGSGTADYVALFNTGSSLTASTLQYDNGSFVGIGTTTNTGLLSIAGQSTSQASLFAQGKSSASAATLVVEDASSQTGDLLDFENSSGVVVSGFNSSGNLYIGNSSDVGEETFYNNTASNGVTLEEATSPTASATINLPDTSGTVCLDNSSSCGFAASSGSGAAFLNNGNAFGTTAILGTTDSNPLELEGDGHVGLTITTSGDTGINTTSSINSGTLSILGQSGQVAVVAKGASSQDIADFLNSSGTKVAYVDSSGDLIGVGGTFSSTLNANGGVSVSSTAVINSSGILQNAAIGTTTNYSNLDEIGTVTSGSIATGFGTISTANNISTTQAVLGATFSDSNVITAGGTFNVNSSGNLVLGNANNTGELILENGTSADGVTLIEAASPSAATTVTIPDTTGTVCLDNSSSCGFALTGGSSAAFVQGGNAFGALGVLGTTDNNSLNIEADGHTGITVIAGGSYSNVGINTTSALSGATLSLVSQSGQIGQIIEGSSTDATLTSELTGTPASACSGTNWSGSGTSASPYVTTGGGSADPLSCNFASGAPVNGTKYEVVYSTAPSVSTDTTTATIGGTSGTASTGTVNSYSVLITAAGTSQPTFYFSSAGDTGSIFNIYIYAYPTTATNAVLQVDNNAGTPADTLEVRSSGSNTNIFIGLNSGRYNNSSSTFNSTTSGVNNTVLGNGALQSNTVGYSNTAQGYEALQNNLDGYNNVGVGDLSLQANLSGYNNTAVGHSSLGANVSGVDNTGLGYSALDGITTGSFNTALGFDSQQTGNVSGVVSVGYETLQSNTASNVTGVGTLALNINTGSGNTAVGYSSLYKNGNGSDNTGLGGSALEYNATGSQDTAIGYGAVTGVSGDSLGDVTAVGYMALGSDTTGGNSTAVGANALQNSTGGNNTSLGYKAGLSNTTGTNNTFLGYNAGYQDSSYASDGFATLSGLQNSAAIGNYSQVQESNAIVLGSVDTATKVGIGVTEPLNTFSVSPLNYNTGTASQASSSSTITGSGTSWTSSMIGDEMIWADGTEETITGYTSSTQLTGSSTSVSESGSHYRLHYIGLQVASGGTVGVNTINAIGSGTLSVQALSSQVALVAEGSGSDIADFYTSGNAEIVSIGSNGLLTVGGGLGTDITTSSGSLGVAPGSTTGSTGYSLTLIGGNSTATLGTGGSVTINAGTDTHTSNTGSISIGTGDGSGSTLSLGSTTAATTILGSSSSSITLGTSSTIFSVTSGGVVNVSTGYQVNGAATSGNYLRGNGTNFVSSALQSGDITTALNGYYIINQTSAQSSSNFNISGTGIAATSMQAPLFDTPSGTTTLNIGTTNATSGIDLNQNVTILSGKTLTVTGTANINNGGSSNTNLGNTSGTLTVIGSSSSSIAFGAALDVSGSYFAVNSSGQLGVKGSSAVATPSITASYWGNGLTIEGGQGSSGSGALYLYGGQSTGGSYASGSVYLDSGNNTATGSNTGNVYVGTSYASAVNIGRSGATTSIQGAAATSSILFGTSGGYTLSVAASTGVITTYGNSGSGTTPIITTNAATNANANDIVIEPGEATCTSSLECYQNDLYLLSGDNTGNYLSNCGVHGCTTKYNTPGNVYIDTGNGLSGSEGTGTTSCYTTSGTAYGCGGVVYIGQNYASLISIGNVNLNGSNYIGEVNLYAEQTNINSGSLSEYGNYVTIDSNGGVLGNTLYVGDSSTTVDLGTGATTLTVGSTSTANEIIGNSSSYLEFNGSGNGSGGVILNGGTSSGTIALEVPGNSSSADISTSYYAHSLTIEPLIGGAVTGGNLVLQGGNDNGSSNTAGAVNINGGVNQNGTGGTGGSINLQAGTGHSTNGSINVGTSTAATVNIGNSSSTDVLIGTTYSSSSAGICISSSTTCGATSSSPILLDLDQATSQGAETSGDCTSTVNAGGIYYSAATSSSSTTTNELRGCINGSWTDIVSADQLGLIMLGVVPNSGSSNVGDLGGITGIANGPCKVVWASSTTVTVNPCIAYSGGRKVVITSSVTVTIPTTASTAEYSHICLNGTNGAPTATADNTSETGGLPAFSASAPVLCLATVLTTNAASPTIANIWDTRVFVGDTFTYTSTNVAMAPGWIAVQYATSANQVTTTTTANSSPVMGTIAVGSSSASGGNTINAIMVINGRAYVEGLASGGFSFTSGDTAQTSGTAGYATQAAAAGGYKDLGLVINTQADSACSASTNCQYSLFVNVNPH